MGQAFLGTPTDQSDSQLSGRPSEMLCWVQCRIPKITRIRFGWDHYHSFGLPIEIAGPRQSLGARHGNSAMDSETPMDQEPTPSRLTPHKASGGESAHIDITHLLVAWGQGDLKALDKVFPLAFEDLRRLARKCCGRIPSKEFQPTELIGEIYQVLLKQRNVSWENRGQFYSFATVLMERILLGYKRALKTDKRGGKSTLVPLIDALDVSSAGDASSLGSPASSNQRQAAVLDALGSAVDVAEKISELAELNPQLAEIARLRYFIGLTIRETGETLGVSTKTVSRKWQHAKRFLALELDDYDSE